jgi:hypothetical protein
MQRLRFFTPALLVCALMMVSAQSAFAAAQLKAGATTSAKPTSTNPQQRAIQITFDPTVTPDSLAGPPPDDSDPGYDVTDFQLTVTYDTSLVTLQDTSLVGPFESPDDSELASPAVPTLGSFTIAGSTNGDPTAAGPGDVNIFLADFTLNPGVSFDTPLTFTIDASGAGDFVEGYDPFTNSYATSTGPDVVQTVLTVSFNQATAQTGGGGGSSTPLPAGAWAGLLALGVCGYFVRRSSKAATARI